MDYISYFTERMRKPEFMPEEIEAQEAMMEPYELPEKTMTKPHELPEQAEEQPPEYWQRKAEQELYENGDSDAYRRYAEKAWPDRGDAGK